MYTHARHDEGDGGKSIFLWVPRRTGGRGRVRHDSSVPEEDVARGV